MLNMFYTVIDFPKVWLSPATYPKDQEKSTQVISGLQLHRCQYPIQTQTYFLPPMSVPISYRKPIFIMQAFSHSTKMLSFQRISDRSNVVLSALTANLTELDFSVNFNAKKFNLAPGHLKTQSGRISKDRLPCTCFSCSVSSASPHAPTHLRATVHWQEHRVSRYVWSPNCENAKSSRSGWECTG